MDTRQLNHIKKKGTTYCIEDTLVTIGKVEECLSEGQTVESLSDRWSVPVEAINQAKRLYYMIEKDNVHTERVSDYERERLEQVVVDVLTEEAPVQLDITDEMIDTIVDDFIQLKKDANNVTNKQEQREKIDTGIKKNMLKRGQKYRRLVKNTDFSSRATEYLAEEINGTEQNKELIEFVCSDCNEYIKRKPNKVDIPGVPPSRCVSCTLSRMSS
jgi:hypothetical protein